MAYAVSYPGGVFGIIAAILLLRWLFRVDPVTEAQVLEEQHRLETPPLTNLHVRVTNTNLVGLKIADIPALDTLGVAVSRVMRGADELVASPSVRLCSGDVLMAVGEPDKLHSSSKSSARVSPSIHRQSIPLFKFNGLQSRIRKLRNARSPNCR